MAGKETGRERRKRERKKGFSHGSLQISCVASGSECLSCETEKTLRIRPPSCDTSFKLWDTQKPAKVRLTKPKGFFFFHRLHHGCTCLRIQRTFGGSLNRPNSLQLCLSLFKVYVWMRLFSSSGQEAAREPSLAWPHCRKHFQMFVFFIFFFLAISWSAGTLRPKEPAIHQTQSLLRSVARWWMSPWNCRDIQGMHQHNKSGYRSEVRGFLSLLSHGRSSSCLHVRSSLCHDGFRFQCFACEDATWLRF